MNAVNEDEWGDLKCLYEAGQAAITDSSGLFTGSDIAWRINERGENEWQNENDNEMSLSRCHRV